MGRDTLPSERLWDIEAFFYAEARMLEENRFDDWLGCLAEDVRYWMPVGETVEAGTINSSDTFALFDDDKKSLELRVLRIKTGNAHAEVPPSTTLRLVTNILVEPAAEGPDVFDVRSSFMVYQERRGQHGVTFYGRREDVLRRSQGALKLARRKIILAQAILPTTISIFF